MAYAIEKEYGLYIGNKFVAYISFDTEQDAALIHSWVTASARSHSAATVAADEP